MMREPAFWWKSGGGSLLALPAGIYGAVAALRMRAAGHDIGTPVICLGNLTVGGAGKTPAALTVARLLLAAHERPFFLTRGYGGRSRGPVRVDPDRHRAADVGDEPLMLARLAPTIVSRDRVAGARAARLDGATVIVMDDGFQNPSLIKTLAILLVDARRGIGNGRVIPAGPLRAPLEIQIARAQALVVVGTSERPESTAAVERARRYGVAIFHGRLEPDREVLSALGRHRVLAFAGIGDPGKFFDTLAAAGVTVAERASFPDHHRYSAVEARALIARADAAGLVLLTTEKDLARLSGEPHLAPLATRATALPVRLRLAEEDDFRAMILKPIQA